MYDLVYYCKAQALSDKQEDGRSAAACVARNRRTSTCVGGWQVVEVAASYKNAEQSCWVRTRAKGMQK